MSDQDAERELSPAGDLGEIRLAYQSVVGVVAAARDSAARSVNAALTVAYWLIGQRLVEYEPSGQDRAEYGTSLIEQLVEDLAARFGRGFSRQNLLYMRQFYLAYPPNRVRQTVSGTSDRTALLSIRQTASGESGASPITTRFLELVDAFPLL